MLSQCLKYCCYVKIRDLYDCLLSTCTDNQQDKFIGGYMIYRLTAHGRTLSLAEPRVMGILNVTPDSFSDGGTHCTLDSAVIHASKMVNDGADIIDVGGESTRPGAAEVSVQEELDRVVPVVEKIAKELDTFISVDTSKPEVMREAFNVGAHMINDIRALNVEGALETCVELNVPVCLMHMMGEPKNMQEDIHYRDLLGDISEFLFKKLHQCLNAGMSKQNIVIDPGIGFGKTMDQNYELLGRLDTFGSFGYPILVGLSRKSLIGKLTGAPVDARLPGSLALAMYSVNKGAKIIRVHDVAETVQALSCWNHAKMFERKGPKLRELLKITKLIKNRKKTNE